MNVPRGGRQLFASLDADRQSMANLARIWSPVPPQRRLAKAASVVVPLVRRLRSVA